MLVIVLLSAASAAPRFEAGVGYRNAFADSEASVHAFGRVHSWSQVALEVGVTGRIPSEPASALDKTLAYIAYQSDPGTALVVPITSETVAVSGLAEWTVGAMPVPGDLTGGLALLGGLELRVGADYEGTPTGDVSNPIDVQGPTYRLIAGPAVGFAMQAWVGSRVGARLCVLERLALEPQRDYGYGTDGSLSLTSSPTWSLDLLFGF